MLAHPERGFVQRGQYAALQDPSSSKSVVSQGGRSLDVLRESRVVSHGEPCTVSEMFTQLDLIAGLDS